MSFSWTKAKRPIVALAPMAGITDASYRRLIKKVAPETVVYTEFLSTDAISFGADKTLKMMEFDPALERPFIVQIFGADPVKFIEACKVVEQMGADGIDINMGCPAAKIVSSCYGSALIRKPELAAEVVNSAVRAVKIPVSVKTRLGWDEKEKLISFCKGLEDAGAQALSIHGRRYCDKFSGKADWEPIYALKKAMKIPVLGNGDISSAEDAVEKLKNLDGVMVGRGTFGNPWLMGDIEQAFEELEEKDENGNWIVTSERLKVKSDEMVSPEEKMDIFKERIPFILMHCEMAIELKGEKRGVLEMRRHLSSYVKGFDGAKELRMKILGIENFSELRTTLASVA